MTILFFGSFQKYSVQVLDKLVKNFDVIGVVTIPPHSAGRHLTLTPTEVAIYSKKHSLSLFEFETLDTLPVISRPDFLVVAGYGKLIPGSWLSFPKVMAVNLHQSLLPKYAGRFPAEWAILNSEVETGDTLIKMSPEFDAGDILAQQAIPIAPDDTRKTLYTKLYDLGGDMLVTYLPKIAAGQITPHPQPAGNYFYAKQITRDDGFIPWETFDSQLRTMNHELLTKFRAFAGWPGVWTTMPNNSRLKLIALAPEVLVQEEGGKIKPWLQ